MGKKNRPQRRPKVERSDRGSPAGAVAAAAAASSGAAAGASTAPAQVDALLVEAARQRDMMEFDHAISLYGQALEAQPSNLEAIDALGELLLEVGDVENATKMLRMSIQLAPDINAGKYMYLGQTLEGADAVESFEQGIAIMEREVQQVQASACQHAASGGGAESSPQSQQELTDMRRGLCAGHCAIAEVLLPDADTTEHIYSRCEQALQRAQQWDESSPEPHQGLANLFLGRGEADAANAALRQSIQLTDGIVDPVLRCSFGFRIGNAKLLLELGHWAEAVAAFEALSREEDGEVELWYMLALSHGLGGDVAAAAECLQRAMTLLGQQDDSMDNTQQMRAQVLAAIQELDALDSSGAGAAQ